MNRRRQLSQLVTDPATALRVDDPALRRIAVAAAQSKPELWETLATMLAQDPDPLVRRECAEVLGRSGANPLEAISAARHDDAATVREAAITALGEIASPASVDALLETAADENEDKLVREGAVAALGAIGDERAVATLIKLIDTGPPQIRRRCVPALSVFDGAEIEAALRRAAADRNPMVREAAEMVVGRVAD
jgi:HEAT repeat protein